MWQSSNPLEVLGKVKGHPIVVFIPAGVSSPELTPGVYAAWVENHHGWHIGIDNARSVLVEELPEGAFWAELPKSG